MTSSLHTFGFSEACGNPDALAWQVLWKEHQVSRFQRRSRNFFAITIKMAVVRHSVNDVRYFVRCSKQQMWLASKILNGYAYNRNPWYFASNVKKTFVLVKSTFIDGSFVVTPPCFGREGESVTADVLSTHDPFALPLKPSQWRCIIHTYRDSLPLL